jgi:nitric oxide reductase subunit C
MLLVLVACFAAQTAFVYSDEPGQVQLSGIALKGQIIWRQNNCQSCHQLYGFGGFMGPDLTNASSRLTPDWLSIVLVEGISQMPAFHMPEEDIAAIAAYLSAMDKTGRGQARTADPTLDNPTFPMEFSAAVRSELSAGDDAAVRKGFGLVELRACWSCHTPLATSLVGAPDLTKTAGRLERDAILDVLKNGRRSMAPTGFNADERKAVVAYLEWLAERRSVLRRHLQLPEIGWRSLWSDSPWWEYR